MTHFINEASEVYKERVVYANVLGILSLVTYGLKVGAISVYGQFSVRWRKDLRESQQDF